MKKSKLSSQALLLFLLSPMIGELLSGSAPPVESFNPVGFVMLAILYGGGAVLASKLKPRWRKGWPTLLVLGTAYGVAEEGSMCKSFFGQAGWILDVNLLCFRMRNPFGQPVYIAVANKVPGQRLREYQEAF